jgi:hypothetical protein
MSVCCWSARALFPDFDPLCSAPATAGEFNMLQCAPAAVKIGSWSERIFSAAVAKMQRWGSVLGFRRRPGPRDELKVPTRYSPK